MSAPFDSILPASWVRKRSRVRLGQNRLRGLFVTDAYLVPATTLTSDVTAVFAMGSLYPGETDTFAPILDDFTLDESPEAGKSLLTLYWRPPSWRQVLENSSGKGVLAISVTTSEYRPQKDTAGQPEWGEPFTATGDSDEFYEGDEGDLVQFKVVEGKGVAYQRRVLVRLQAVLTNTQVGNLLALVGTVNDAKLENIFSIAAGKMYMHGGHSERLQKTTTLSFVDVVMEYNPTGWNDDTRSAAFVYRVRKRTVLDEDGEPIDGQFRNVGAWEDAGQARLTLSNYETATWTAVTGIDII